jgi:ribonuclease-3
VEEKGPAHDKHFTVEVSFGGVVYGVGSGSTKKIAEQNAAKEAFTKKAIIDGTDLISKK